MRRKYKLILIIGISIILAYLIYFFNKEDKIYLVSFGDGVASGETSYNIDGISYNDYIKEYFYSKKILKEYNSSFATKNYLLGDFIGDIENNLKDEKKDKYIKQIIHRADIITINFGEDELTKLSITNDLTEEKTKKFINDYDKLLSLLKEITEAKIVVIGLYENDYLNKTNTIIFNSEIANIVNKYESIFINISDLLTEKEYYLNKNSYYFDYKAHKIIAEIIIHSI